MHLITPDGPFSWARSGWVSRDGHLGRVECLWSRAAAFGMAVAFGYGSQRPPAKLPSVYHSMLAYRSGVKMKRALLGSGARISSAVPSQVAPLSDSSDP
jgi:hypothetical protein